MRRIVSRVHFFRLLQRAFHNSVIKRRLSAAVHNREFTSLILTFQHLATHSIPTKSKNEQSHFFSRTTFSLIIFNLLPTLALFSKTPLRVKKAS